MYSLNITSCMIYLDGILFTRVNPQTDIYEYYIEIPMNTSHYNKTAFFRRFCSSSKFKKRHNFSHAL